MKTKLNLISIIFLLLLLSSCGKSYNSAEEEIDKTEGLISEPINIEFPTEIPIIESLPQTIPEKEEVIEVNYEEELEIQQAKQIEILNNASEEGNLEACDSITSERLKSQCVDNANLSLASKENDKTYCEKVQDSFWRNNCISSFQSGFR